MGPPHNSKRNTDNFSPHISVGRQDANLRIRYGYYRHKSSDKSLNTDHKVDDVRLQL